MKTEKYEVKSAPEKGEKAVVVAVIEVEQYDTLAEAVAKHGEVTVLSLFNTQFSTNAKNRARAEATGKPSQKSLRDQATAELLALPPNEIAAIAALGAEAVSAEIDKRAARIATELQAKRKQVVPDAEAEGEETPPQ
jgi:hypothetical protein